MGYGASAEEERMLSYSPKEIMASTGPTPSQSLPASVGSGMPRESATPPSGVSPTDAPASSVLSAQSIPPAVAAHTNRFVSYARQTWDERRPWKEFYSTRAVSVPKFADLSDRFASNLHVYRANYQIIGAGWLVLMLLGSLESLLFAGLGFWGLGRWAGWRAEKNGGTLQHKHKIIAVLISLLIVWATGLGSYLVRSLVCTGFMVAAHASLHEPQTDETEIATV